MNIDLADLRELTVYKRDFWRGAPALLLLGLALLPLFGAGAILLGVNAWKTRRQALVVSHQQLWFQSSNLMAATVCCDRRDITGVEVRQTWLQSRLGTADLIIHAKDLEYPIRVCGLTEAISIQHRLTRHLPEASWPDYMRKVVPVGQAPRAPRLLQVKAA